MLTPGEITKGMRVTVVSWKPPEIPIIETFGAPLWSTITMSNDRSYCGDVLEVIAVDLPYIVIKNLCATIECLKQPTQIDTREATLKELKPDYIAALIGNK